MFLFYLILFSWHAFNALFTPRWRDGVQKHLLWMILVNRAVHSNSGTQLLSCFVIPDLPQHCHQSGSTQVCGTCRYYLTHPPSGYAVLIRWVYTQAPEHLFSTSQTFLISAGKAEYKSYSITLWLLSVILNRASSLKKWLDAWTCGSCGSGGRVGLRLPLFTCWSVLKQDWNLNCPRWLGQHLAWQLAAIDVQMVE